MGGNLSLTVIILFYAAIIVGLIHFFYSHKIQPVCYFFGGAVVAIWLSLPFLSDAPFRSLAAVFPIIAALIAIGILGWRSGTSQISLEKNDSFDYVKFSAGLGIGILVLSMIIPIIGPGITGFLMRDVQHISYNTPRGEETFIMRIDMGVPYIEIVNDTIPHTFAPQIIYSDFKIPDWIKKYYNITDFPDDQTHPVFLRGYDELSNRTLLILAPSEFIPHQRQILTFNATSIDPSLPWPLKIYKIT